MRLLPAMKRAKNSSETEGLHCDHHTNPPPTPPALLHPPPPAVHSNNMRDPMNKNMTMLNKTTNLTDTCPLICMKRDVTMSMEDRKPICLSHSRWTAGDLLTKGQ